MPYKRRATRKHSATTGRKKTPKDTKPANQYVAIKKSCNNLYGPYATLEDAEKDGKQELMPGYSYYESRHRNTEDSVTIYKLVPVKRIIREAAFTEETLDEK